MKKTRYVTRRRAAYRAEIGSTIACALCQTATFTKVNRQHTWCKQCVSNLKAREREYEAKTQSAESAFYQPRKDGLQ